MKKNHLLLMLLLSCFLLAACTNQSKEPVDSTEILNQNKKSDASEIVKKYYESLISNNYGTAYDCLSNETKLKYSFEKFKENQELQLEAFGLTGYEIADIDDLNPSKIFYIKTTRPNFESSPEPMIEPAIVVLEENEYKISIGEELNKITSMACNKIAFNNLYSSERDFDYIAYISKKAIELDPKNNLSYADLARSYSLAGNITSALEAIDKYIYLSTSFEKDDKLLSEIYQLKGLNLLGQHKTNEAIDAYEKALNLDPTNDIAFESLQDIK